MIRRRNSPSHTWHVYVIPSACWSPSSTVLSDAFPNSLLLASYPAPVPRSLPVSTQRLFCSKAHHLASQSACQNWSTNQRQNRSSRAKWLFRLKSLEQAACRSMGGRKQGTTQSPSSFSPSLTKFEFPQIFIKDVKSSNGTFINSERLSPEGVESEPYELKSDDIVVCWLFLCSIAALSQLSFTRNSGSISSVRTTRR